MARTSETPIGLILLFLALSLAETTASACARRLAEAAGPERIRLWEGREPVLPYNKALSNASKGATLVFGDGTEIRTTGTVWGESSTESYGRVFTTGARPEHLWVPYFTRNPRTAATFARHKKRVFSHASDLLKLHSKLGEFLIPVLAIRAQGYEQQYFWLEPFPRDSVALLDFLNPLSQVYLRLTRSQKIEMEERLVEFARLSAPFTEIGVEDVTKNLFYHPSKGWFLRECTGYNQMYSPPQPVAGVYEAPSVFSGELQAKFVFSSHEFEEQMERRQNLPYAAILPPVILNPDALGLFVRIHRVIEQARLESHGIRNRVSSERPLPPLG